MILPLELDTFRAFKRDGAIPMNARRDLYRIRWTWNSVELWRVGIRRRGSCYLYERHIASMQTDGGVSQ